jgi:peroxiredoxin
MKRITTRLMMALGAIIVLFSACSDNRFTVKGVVSGAEGQTMLLENVGVSSVEILDSIKLNAAGTFTFKHSRPQYPDFYRLRLNNQLINFSIDSTEIVSFSADAGTFATSYIAEGSENAKAIKQITLAQLDANQAIGRLRKDYDSKLISDTTYREQVLEAAEAYKEVARKYIYSAPMSTAAYYALFQQIDGLYFFNLYDKDDSKAYGAVATSYDFNYPESARAKHLHSLALQSIKVIRQQRALDAESVNFQEINYLDITLPNLNGEIVKLSEVAEGKTVLVNFTAYQNEWSPTLNMDFAGLYEKYSNKGFTIYQVSLDIDKHFWKNVASKLPWICVHDPDAAYSQIAALYNVKQLPALFLINKKGEIVKRIEDLRALDDDIQRILK